MPSDYPLCAKQVVDRLNTLVSVPCALKKKMFPMGLAWIAFWHFENGLWKNLSSISWAWLVLKLSWSLLQEYRKDMRGYCEDSCKDILKDMLRGYCEDIVKLVATILWIFVARLGLRFPPPPHPPPPVDGVPGNTRSRRELLSLSSWQTDLWMAGAGCSETSINFNHTTGNLHTRRLWCSE
jgi:hypothetical protein